MYDRADRDTLLHFFQQISAIPGISRLDITTNTGVTYTVRASGTLLALEIDMFSGRVELDQERLLSDPKYVELLTRTPQGQDAIDGLIGARDAIFHGLTRKATELTGRRYSRGRASKQTGSADATNDGGDDQRKSA